MDVALITASQWFLNRQLQRRVRHGKENPILGRWLADNFSAQEASGRIVLPEDRLLRDALRARGVDAQIAAWDNPAIDWSGVKLCVVRSPGDWCFRWEEFLRWADGVQRVTKIWNSAGLMRWAADKSYLMQLIERGMTVVPTFCFPRGANVELGAFLEEHGWPEAILKPLTGQGSMGIMRTSLSPAPGAKPIGEAQVHLNALLHHRGALVQSYFPAVEKEGELSMIYIRGRVTHAVRKFPQSGDFRAYGTPNSRQDPAPVDGAMSDFAERAIRAVGMPVEFGRIDVISDAEGRMHLLELEFVQPRLFLSSSTEALEGMVRGICLEVGAAHQMARNSLPIWLRTGMADEQQLSGDLTSLLEALPHGQLVEITRRAAIGAFGATCRGLLGDTSLADFVKSIFPRIPDAQIPAVTREMALSAIRNTCWPQLLSLPGEWHVKVRCLHPVRAQALRDRKGPAIIAFWHHGATHMVPVGLQTIGVPAVFIGTVMPGGWFKRTVSADMKFILTGDSRQSALALKTALDRLRQGGAVAVAVDGSSGAGQIEAPFLGRKFPIARGIAVLARLTGAPIIPVLATWIGRDWSIDFRIDEALPLPPIDSMGPDDWERAVVTTTVKHFERVVRTCPGQSRLEQLDRLNTFPRV